MEQVLFLFVFCLIFLNGATDAANSIAAAVASGALTMGRGALLSACGNLLGGILSAVWFADVGRRVEESADFGAFGAAGTLSALVATVVFTAAMWALRLPTSESHALLSAIAGVRAALGQGDVLSALLPAVLWMSLCTLGGFLMGWLLSCPEERRFLPRRVKRWQVGTAFVSSVLHGVQDLPKFLALLSAASLLPAGSGVWLLAALVMGVGTLAGGRRMTEAVGSDLSFLTPSGALRSDVAAGAVMLLLSGAGVPGSTTHAKTAAVAGVALRGRGCRLHRKPFYRFLVVWLVTFPLCAALGAGFARLFLFFS